MQTICYAVVIALVGHVLLVVCAIPSVIASPHASIAVFSIAIIIMGAGTGGFKSNISPLVAEQAKNQRLQVVTLKDGSRVIHDPSLTSSRIYMYFYLLINVGALIGQIGMVYAEKNVGFWLAYLLPTLVFLLCPIVLYIGRNRYVLTPPSGSLLPNAIRVWRRAAKGRWSDAAWDATKPSHIAAEERPKWMTFDDAWVDEVRRGLGACLIFAYYPIYWLCYK